MEKAIRNGLPFLQVGIFSYIAEYTDNIRVINQIMTLMKKLFTIFAILLFSLKSFAQEGVKWEQLTLDEAVAKMAAGECDKKYIFLYFGTDIPYDMEWVEFFNTELAGNYFNGRYLCIMADAATPYGAKLEKRLKTLSYPSFYVFDSKGTREASIGTAHNMASLILSLDKRIEKIDSTMTYRHKYRTTGDTAVAYQYMRLTRQADDPNSLGYFVAEFFNELLKSPDFWNVYKSVLSIEAMTMIDWTFEYRNSFRKAAPIEQIEQDLADIILAGMKGYIADISWGNELTISDATNYFTQLRTPSKLEQFILSLANARAVNNMTLVRQLCSRQNMARHLSGEEILAVKDLFLSIKEISEKEKEIFLKSIEPLIAKSETQTATTKQAQE